MFETLTDRLGSALARLRSKGRLSPADVDTALGEVRRALLDADVNVDVVDALLARIRGRAVGSEVAGALTPGQQVVKIVQEELVATLGVEAAPLATGDPAVILVVGLQGSGKTTTAAKLAYRLKRQGSHPLLVATDQQRPAAAEQLRTLADRAEVPVHEDPGVKPARVVTAALKRAAADGLDAVVIDTAGRMQVDRATMDELARIAKAASPSEVLLVVDAMTGQDAVAVATGFLERVDLTGLILSKLDGDARGGAAISARAVTERPVKFVGVGEGLDDLEVFHPDRMASRILGMGDVLTLIEKAESSWDEQQAVEATEKLRTASFTLEDFLEQLQQFRKMGSVGQLLGMLPGASGLDTAGVSDADFARVEAIIRSMTPVERRDPKTIDGSRRRRIAGGSGTTPQDVNGLLKQFAQTRKLMKAFAQGRAPLPGMPQPGRRRKKR